MPDAEPDCEGPVEVNESYFGGKEGNKQPTSACMLGAVPRARQP